GPAHHSTSPDAESRWTCFPYCAFHWQEAARSKQGRTMSARPGSRSSARDCGGSSTALTHMLSACRLFTTARRTRSLELRLPASSWTVMQMCLRRLGSTPSPECGGGLLASYTFSHDCAAA